MSEGFLPRREFGFRVAAAGNECERDEYRLGEEGEGEGGRGEVGWTGKEGGMLTF